MMGGRKNKGAGAAWEWPGQAQLLGLPLRAQGSDLSSVGSSQPLLCFILQQLTPFRACLT